MRCYHFGNYYLSSIQQGIQAAHAQMELFNKYDKIDLYDYGISSGSNPPEHIVRRADLANKLFDWSKHHKTMVCLNGGNNKDLQDIKELFTMNNVYPWSYFCEDNNSLGGIITNVAIVLPEDIYITAQWIREKLYKMTEFDGKYDIWGEEGKFIKEISQFDYNLINLLNKCGLAK